jgi:hypothetical protein
MARKRHLSANRVILELIEGGIEAGKRRQQEFFELADASAMPQTPQRSSASATKWVEWSSAADTESGNFGASSRKESGGI